MSAELAVLGSMMIDPLAADEAMDTLTPEDFASHENAEVFRTALLLRSRKMTVDFVTLIGALQELGTLDMIGGAAFLVECSQYVPTSANIRSYLQQVKRDSQRRSLLSGIQALLIDGAAKEPVELAAEMTLLASRVEAGEKQASDSIKAIVLEEYEAMGRRSEGAERPLATGIVGLDKLAGGLVQGEIWVVGARPSVGKSALGMQIAEHVVQGGKRALFFSAEMSRAMVAQRFFASQGLPAYKVRSGELADEDWDLAAGALAASQLLENLHIDTMRSSVPQMRSRCRQMQAHGGLDLVVVDYLQIIQPDGRRENRNLEVAAVSADLKRMAKEINVPVIVLSQLSRNMEQRSGMEKRPRLSDLRDSGGTEQDADVVVMLYRLDEQQAAGEYGPMMEWLQESGNQIVRMEIAKNRNGPLGHTDMMLDGARVRFVPPIAPIPPQQEDFGL